MVDWGQAFKVAGIGFGGVAITILLVIGSIMVTSAVIRRINKLKDDKK
jgi:hypothetical protein